MEDQSQERTWRSRRKGGVLILSETRKEGKERIGEGVGGGYRH